MDEIIHINAGGQPFSAKRSTLLMAPQDSLLNIMFSGRWSEESLSRDTDGRIFLDMSPQSLPPFFPNSMPWPCRTI